MLLIRIAAPLAVIFCIAGSSSPARAGAPECRDVPFKYGEESHVIRMCKGSDGRWQEVSHTTDEKRYDPSPETADATPTPKRVEVEYHGTFNQTVYAPPNRSSNSGNILGAILQGAAPRIVEQPRGAFTITAILNGAASTATFSGTGLQTIRTEGTAQNGYCRFFGSTQGGYTISYEGRCTPQGFSGKMAATGRGGARLEGQFETTATKSIDLDERDRQQAAARAEAERQAAVARAEADRKAAAQAIKDRKILARVEADAAKGDISAIAQLGRIFEVGEYGVQRDLDRARQYYLRASAAGHASASSGLAEMYKDGNGVDQSNALAHRYTLACASGKPGNIAEASSSVEIQKIYEQIKTLCMKISARHLYNGVGVVRDEQAAVIWYRRCAARGDDDCIKWLNEHGAR